MHNERVKKTHSFHLKQNIAIALHAEQSPLTRSEFLEKRSGRVEKKYCLT